jgi:hypothetical protein
MRKVMSYINIFYLYVTRLKRADPDSYPDRFFFETDPDLLFLGTVRTKLSRIRYTWFSIKCALIKI